MNSKEKQQFRNTKEWKDFRDKIKKKQKKDPITNKPLTKNCNLHHRDFDENKYNELIEEKFICLNPQTHDVLHFVYGSGNKLKDWRTIIQKLIEQCEEMDKYNRREE